MSDRITEKLEQYIRQTSPEILSDTDFGEIREGWENVFCRYRGVEKSIPDPEWKVRTPEFSGSGCWDLLRDKSFRHSTEPVSIYIHIPYCDRKCGFCDCHSERASLKASGVFDVFTEKLLSETGHWSDLPNLRERKVTTIHFGGGTPNYLPREHMSRIVKDLRGRLNVTGETEFALESTSSLLTKDHLDGLKDLGFRRLHIGVQTLNDFARKKIGRKETARAVMEKLELALSMDFIVSVDVIYGLPYQQIDSLIHTLNSLIAAGIHGFSLYHLNITDRNRKFFSKIQGFERDLLQDYLDFIISDQLLIRHGYRKNHFVHYARREDKNLYYNHACRGEDLLALGPTADGIFRNFYYIHYWIKEYLSFSKTDHPPLWGGGYLSEREYRIRPMKAELLCSKITESSLKKYNIQKLIDDWMESDLIKKQNEEYCLTGNGSWYIDKMAGELMDFCT